MLTDADPIVTNQLRRLRRREGLPMYGLAVKATVSPTIIGMIERYDYRPGMRVRERIATALGVEIGEIWPAEEKAREAARQ
jgi:DNA-binding XRE family transcriptional regulator